jgi:hypothetical protein
MKLFPKVRDCIIAYDQNRQSFLSSLPSFLGRCVNDYVFNHKSFFTTIRPKFLISFFNKNLIVIS